jgi:GNAT superfamily N-acetyltransferase
MPFALERTAYPSLPVSIEPHSQTLMPIADFIPRTGCTRRPANDADEAFLLSLYAQERTAEWMLAGLDAGQCQMLVQMQFRARRMGYATNHQAGVQEIVCAEDGAPAGTILVERTAEGMHLIDIAVIDGRRSQGFGTAVIRELQQECRTRKWTLKLQVLKGNPAERLYRKLGFEVVGEDSLRRQMLWSGPQD